MTHITVLSRVKDVDRRKSIESQLRGSGYSWCFFDAIEPHNLPPNLSPTGKLTTGELCCSYSHYKIADDFTRNYTTDKNMIILEDDAEIHQDLKNIEATLTEGHKKFDVIIIGYSKTNKKTIRSIQWYRPLLQAIKLEDFSIGIPYKHWKCGTVAYSISMTGAQKISSMRNAESRTADDWLFLEKHGLTIGHLMPIVITEKFDEFGSSLENERKTHKNRPTAIRWLAGLIRHLLLLNLFVKISEFKK